MAREVTEAGKTLGHITPRASWPRPATPTDLIPNWAGEFVSFEDWVNFATKRLTGTIDPLMGHEVVSICVDALGRRCTMGGHFMRARDENAFPVRFFWDCSPALSGPEPADASPEGAATADDPTPAEISRAAWAWRNDKDRETDSSDDAYFLNNWQSLPGLRAYVTAQVELGRPLAQALAKAGA